MACCCVLWPGQAQTAPIELRAAIQRLADEDERARGDAVGVLVAAGRASLPFLEEALANDDPRVQAHAAWAAGELGSEARALTAVLVRLLVVTPQPPAETAEAALMSGWLLPIRNHAAWALGRIGRDADTAVPALAAALAGNDGVFAAAAADALARMGPRTAPHLPAMRERLAKETAGILQHVLAHALVSAGEPGVVALARMLDDPAHSACHESAAWALGATRRNAAAVAALVRAASRRGRDEGQVRVTAGIALGLTGAEDDAALTTLARSLLEDWDSSRPPATAIRQCGQGS